MIQSLGTEHPGHVLGLCQLAASDFAHQHQAVQAQPPTPGADVWGNAPLCSLYPKSEG